MRTLLSSPSWSFDGASRIVVGRVLCWPMGGPVSGMVVGLVVAFLGIGLAARVQCPTIVARAADYGAGDGLTCMGICDLTGKGRGRPH